VLGGQKSGACGRSTPTRQGCGARVSAKARHSAAFTGHRIRWQASVRADQSALRHARAQPNAAQKAGMHALNVDTGEVAWTFAAEPTAPVIDKRA